MQTKKILTDVMFMDLEEIYQEIILKCLKIFLGLYLALETITKNKIQNILLMVVYQRLTIIYHHFTDGNN